MDEDHQLLLKRTQTDLKKEPVNYGRRKVMTGTSSHKDNYILTNGGGEGLNGCHEKEDKEERRGVAGGRSRPAHLGGHQTNNPTPLVNNSINNKLKCVIERMNEKERVYLPRVDREGKALGDNDYCLPSPPERDMPSIDDYAYNEAHLSQLSIDGGYDGSESSLTRSELDQYTRTYDELRASHSQQPSYAQSEGYHSYVSSTDSTTTTPFIDRLRRDSDYVAGRESSASSGSSSETLKWHGSLSDVSSFPAIAHSARVPMPQRHHSESVLYLGGEPWNNRRLFPVSTYEPTSSPPRSPPKMSVAERVCELEKQHQHGGGRCEMDKRQSSKGVTDHASLKAIQKKALLSFYERHHSAWKSEPQLSAPPPPPRPAPPPPPLAPSTTSSRRSSSASDYMNHREPSRTSFDGSYVSKKESRHQYSSSCGSLVSTSVMGPVIVGPAISVDDWVPARPPKKPHLRAAFAALQRPTSPELPPPPSPAPDEAFYSDEPLPPPPPELLDDPPRNGYSSKFNERFVDNMIESRHNYCDLGKDLWDKKNYNDMRSGERKPHLLSPPLPSKGRRPSPMSEQPRSLDSNLSLLESRLNKPGPQTPTFKKSPPLYNGDKLSYKEIRESIIRSQNEPMVFRSSVERQSLRFSKPLTNGKLISSKSSSSSTTQKPMSPNKLQNGKVSPPSPQKATLVRTPSDVVRKISFATGIHYAEPLVGKPVITETHYTKQLSLTDQSVKTEPVLTRQVSHTEPLLTKMPSLQQPLLPDLSAPNKHSTSLVESTSILKPSSEPALSPHCPPTNHQLSQSKASYLSYRRESREKEKGLPNFQGSYKRTMSPSRIIQTSVECEKEALKELVDEVLEESQGKEGKDLAKSLARNFSSVSASAVPVQPPVKRTTRPTRASSDPTTSSVIIDITKNVIEDKPIEVNRLTPEDKPVIEEDNRDCDNSKVNDSPILERVNGEVSPQVERSLSCTISDPIQDSSPPSSISSSILSVADVASQRVSDASSQTTPAPSPPPAPLQVAPNPTQPLPRRQLQEEIDCEQLGRHLASQLSPSHKLHNLLAPGPEVKRSTDYVSELFRLDLPTRSRNSPVTLQESSNNNNSSESSSTPFIEECDNSKERLNGTPEPSDENFSTMGTLQQKKEELVARLSRKLLVLRSEAVAVTEETRINDALGASVAEKVEHLARPHEASKFQLHVREIGHITSLLLGLSGRLARAENALLTLSTDHKERKALETKRDKLLSQLSEAKKLKENIDKRSDSVSATLYNYLTGEEYTDYDHFINMKTKLLVDSREIAEKIQLGEEQLAALKETLDQVR